MFLDATMDAPQRFRFPSLDDAGAASSFARAHLRRRMTADLDMIGLQPNTDGIVVEYKRCHSSVCLFSANARSISYLFQGQKTQNRISEDTANVTELRRLAAAFGETRRNKSPGDAEMISEMLRA